MAISTTVKTATGEEKELYLRINNIEASNHGVTAFATIRGFISRAAYEEGCHFAHEEVIELDVNVSLPIWEQVYAHLKEKYQDATDC